LQPYGRNAQSICVGEKKTLTSTPLPFNNNNNNKKIKAHPLPLNNEINIIK
jgi:hypothetical protein